MRNILCFMCVIFSVLTVRQVAKADEAATVGDKIYLEADIPSSETPEFYWIWQGRILSKSTTAELIVDAKDLGTERAFAVRQDEHQTVIYGVSFKIAAAPPLYRPEALKVKAHLLKQLTASMPFCVITKGSAFDLKFKRGFSAVFFNDVELTMRLPEQSEVSCSWVGSKKIASIIGPAEATVSKLGVKIESGLFLAQNFEKEAESTGVFGVTTPLGGVVNVGFESWVHGEITKKISAYLRVVAGSSAIGCVTGDAKVQVSEQAMTTMKVNDQWTIQKGRNQNCTANPLPVKKKLMRFGWLSKSHIMEPIFGNRWSDGESEILRLFREPMKLNEYWTIGENSGSNPARERDDEGDNKSEAAADVEVDHATEARIPPQVRALLDQSSKDKEWLKVLQQIDQMPEPQVQNTVICVLKAQSLVRLSELELAKKTAEKCVENDETAAEAYYVLGQVAEAKGHSREALDWYAKAKQSDSASKTRLLRTLALSAEGEKNYRMALKSWRELQFLPVTTDQYVEAVEGSHRIEGLRPFSGSLMLDMRKEFNLAPQEAYEANIGELPSNESFVTTSHGEWRLNLTELQSGMLVEFRGHHDFMVPMNSALAVMSISDHLFDITAGRQLGGWKPQLNFEIGTQMRGGERQVDRFTWALNLDYALTKTWSTELGLAFRKALDPAPGGADSYDGLVSLFAVDADHSYNANIWHFKVSGVSRSYTAAMNVQYMNFNFRRGVLDDYDGTQTKLGLEGAYRSFGQWQNGLSLSQEQTKFEKNGADQNMQYGVFSSWSFVGLWDLRIYYQMYDRKSFSSLYTYKSTAVGMATQLML
jgi:tetratricopeptide (TPR) repeat protein